MKLDSTTRNKPLYTERVIQFGEGNFLRAFVDDFIDDMNEKIGYDSSIVVVQPIENGLIDILNEQNGLYTLYKNGIEEGQLVREKKIVKSISRGINPYEKFDEYLDVAKQEEIRFVFSNTTESGIVFDEKDKFDDKPQSSFPGKVTRMLFERYKFFKGDNSQGLIFIPCELIEKNGDKLKEIIIKMANKWGLDTRFIQWIEEANSFCNTLVDRIVPGYPKNRIAEITEELGYEDKLVVEGELFHLWVIEGGKTVKEEFPADKVNLNIIFTDDQTPYRTRKVRILNGAHTSMVPVGLLYGLSAVRETVENDRMGKFVNDLIFEEIIPTLDLSKDELVSYGAAVLDRFKNPYIHHLLINISLNSNAKYETRVLPSVLEYQKRKGILPKRMVFALAALIMLFRGKYNNLTFDLKDNQVLLNMYQELWKNYDGTTKGIEKIVTTVLKRQDIWKIDLNNVEGLASLTSYYLKNIDVLGLNKALEELL